MGVLRLQLSESGTMRRYRQSSPEQKWQRMSSQMYFQIIKIQALIRNVSEIRARLLRWKPLSLIHVGVLIGDITVAYQIIPVGVI